MTMNAPADNPLTTMVPIDDLPWAVLWEGIEMKVLRRGEATGVYTLLNRFAPGVEIPKHRHIGAVHGYTIQGCWGYREYDWIAGAGAYVFEPSNSTHTLYVPDGAEEPAVVVFVIEQALVLLDEQGNEFMTQDSATIDAMYRDCLAARGIEYPAGVLP